MGSIPGQGTNILHATKHSQKIWEKRKKKKVKQVYLQTNESRIWYQQAYNKITDSPKLKTVVPQSIASRK